MTPLWTHTFTPIEIAWYTHLGRLSEYAYTEHLSGPPDAEEDCSDYG